jgi:(S)-mandelate dehydrogenase
VRGYEQAGQCRRVSGPRAEAPSADGFRLLEGGAEDELGLRHNRQAFESVRFKPHRLVDVSARDISTALLGKSLSAPFVIAPTGLNGIFWPDGDLVLARAAAKFGIPFALSTALTASIEEVSTATDGELWFQLYVVHWKLVELLVKRGRSTPVTRR